MMSKERELLKKWMKDCMWRGSNMSLLEETKELLSQPEQKLREELREDLREGVSLRDHFAGLAMQGIVATDDDITYKFLSSVAYGMADAMLKEREKRDV